MMRSLLTLFALLSIFTSQAQNPPKRELRGAWITSYFGLDWPNKNQTPAQQQSALITILNHHQATGINVIYFQVRSQCDALYPSSIEPWSNDLTGLQGKAPVPFWDPLQFAIDESHKRGMELHAWLNPYRAVGNTAIPAPNHVTNTHPEWILTSSATLKILNPALQAVRDYVNSVISDIVQRYDVDGIHFDDYFYPNAPYNDDGYFTADPRGFTSRGDWRRDNVNLFIKQVYEMVAGIKPWVKFGVSPSGIYRSSTDPAIGSNTSSGAFQHYSAIFADSKKWLQEGWVDYLAPQVYWYIGQPGSDYKVLIPWWNSIVTNERHIYMGMAAYKVNTTGWTSRSEIPNQMRLNRDPLYPNIKGEIYFRTANLVSNLLNFRDSLRLRFYQKPSLQPTMPWRDNTPPEAASSLTAVKYQNDSVVLNWAKPSFTANELDKAKRFVIYRSQNETIDITDANNIIVITPNDTTAFADKTIEPNTTYYYTVTAIDRFHNESNTTNTANNLPPTITCPADQQLYLDASCSVTVPDYRDLATVTSTAGEITITQMPVPGAVIIGRGNTNITLTATDAGGNYGTCNFILTAIDNQPPVITGAYANPSSLWPPNHKMKNLDVFYTVTDNCGSVTTTLSVTSNEPESGTGDDHVADDWEIINNHKVKLRAERSGSGSGRIYTITITSVDAGGNIATQTVTVTVPHNRAPVTSTSPRANAKEDETIKGLVIKSTPNPAVNQFTINIRSASSEPVSIKVSDNNGRIIERRNGITVTGSLILGRNYRPGIYYVEVMQGKTKKIIKLIKAAG